MSSPYGPATAVIGFEEGPGPAFTEQEVDALLAESGIEYSIASAKAPGHTSELARQAVEEGCRYLIAVGDDWTVHEVANGIMGESGPLDPQLVLAVIPKEGGSDFLRTVGLSVSPADSVRHLDGEPYFAIDVGRVTCGEGGDRSTTYLVNMAQVGFAGEMVRRRRALPRKLGRLGDLLAFWLTLALFRIPKGTVKIDRRSYGGPLANVVIANGQFVRDGVRMAVKAHPGDGKFDVLIQKGTKRDVIETMNKALKAEHVPSKMIKEFLSSRVEVTCDVPAAVEVDGRMVGFTPATFEIIPEAIRLKI